MKVTMELTVGCNGETFVFRDETAVFLFDNEWLTDDALRHAILDSYRQWLKGQLESDIRRKASEEGKA